VEFDSDEPFDLHCARAPATTCLIVMYSETGRAKCGVLDLATSRERHNVTWRTFGDRFGDSFSPDSSEIALLKGGCEMRGWSCTLLHGSSNAS
jgi:hypothetical protein